MTGEIKAIRQAYHWLQSDSRRESVAAVVLLAAVIGPITMKARQRET